MAAFVAFLYRRLRSVAAEVDLEDEAQAERVPLLDRYRTFFQTSQTASAAALERFRAVIFGARADTASPEIPRSREEEEEENDDREDPHAPSAPPPPYAAEDPIIRHQRSLANENFISHAGHSGSAGAMRVADRDDLNQDQGTEMAVLRQEDCHSPGNRQSRRMEEVPLSKSLI